MATPQQQPPIPPATSIAQQLARLQTTGQQGLSSSSPQSLVPPPAKHRRGISGSKVREWLNVLGAFLVPLMIGLYTVAYNAQQNQQQQEQRQQQDDQQREAILGTYLHDMNDLIFSQGLRTSKAGDEVRVVARAQTLAALRQLDRERKGVAIQFLSEAGLITKKPKEPDAIVRLYGANLAGANLHEAVLTGADLTNADLTNADLIGADLTNADLSGADLTDAVFADATLKNVNLSGANLTYTDIEGADLSGANLSEADLSGADLRRATWAEPTCIEQR